LPNLAQLHACYAVASLFFLIGHRHLKKPLRRNASQTITIQKASSNENQYFSGVYAGGGVDYAAASLGLSGCSTVAVASKQ